MFCVCFCVEEGEMKTCEEEVEECEEEDIEERICMENKEGKRDTRFVSQKKGKV